MIQKKYVIQFILFLWAGLLNAGVFQVQSINSRDGLSNSAVLSMYQDNNGFLWIGTYNGLNRYDGKFIESYGLDENGNNIQASNIINNIQQADNNCLWLSTYIGFNKFSTDRNRVIEHYSKYDYPYNLASNGSGLTTLIAKKDYVSIYNKQEHKFVDIKFLGVNPHNIIASFFDANDFLWIISNNGQVWQVKIDLNEKGKALNPKLESTPLMLINDKLNAAFEDNGLIHFVTSSGDLYSYDIERKKNNYIQNIAQLIARYGIISSISSFHDDFWISFKVNGLVKLSAANKYSTEMIDANTGIFCLLKDSHQDILWVGTDGHGIQRYGMKTSIFNTILSSSLPIQVQKPIRSIFTDKSNTLWIGTKGDGLILVKDYERFAGHDIPAAYVSQYKEADGLSSNQVFYIKNSEFHDLIWLGTAGPGISYFSNTNKRIYSLINNTGTDIKSVHALVEETDSILWLATSTYGLLRVSYFRKGGKLIAKNIKTFEFEHQKKMVNDLFSIKRDRKGMLLIGSRGDGLISFNPHNYQYQFITSKKSYNSPMDDILSTCMINNTDLYLGTGAGLLKLLDTDLESKLIEIPNKTHNGMRQMIHGIQVDKTGCLWMSTTHGLEKYNPKNNVFHKYVKYTGLDIIEFSDNADYKCPYSDRIFFGGIDGVAWIEQDIPDYKTYAPSFQFTDITSNGVKRNISPYLKEKNNEKRLELDYNQNTFSIAFVAIDFLRGTNIEYLYQLENYSKDWYNADEQNSARFNALPPGKYRLNVKYKYDVFDKESEYYSLIIVVNPPWYFSTWAWIFYTLLFIAIIYGVLSWVYRKAIIKRQAFNQQIIEKNKDELYETKMKFFTNITHEFLTPLTLIQGPCERIIDYKNSDDYIKKYAGLLKVNIERLQLLIHEIINFSKREEFGEQSCQIERVQLNNTFQSIEMAFAESAERSEIDFQFEMPSELYWNTDISCFNKIMMNLVSNAFKYTPACGKIKIKVSVENEEITISVFNTGKGINNSELNKVFDRFRILDNMDQNAYLDFSSRNGLGLAICYALIKQLNGNVDVKSEINKYAEFVVRLPKLEINTDTKTDKLTLVENYKSDSAKNSVKASSISMNTKKKLLVVDDNKDIVWMVSELMQDKFQIVKAYNVQEALNVLDDELPELIVVDLMMPGELDGIDLVKRVKANKYTANIPIIIISAKNSIEDQIAGIEFGADFYLTKPFNLSYLRTTIEKLIERKTAMKDFYNSPLSAIELKNGQIMHHEDQQFLDQVKQIIDKNMIIGELRPEFIAEQLRMSPQVFYRKLKAISSLSPTEFIKRYRLSVAARLLLSTNVSVKEITYKVGINNRSYFYREFSKLYDSTPKEYRIHNEVDNE